MSDTDRDPSPYLGMDRDELRDTILERDAEIERLREKCSGETPAQPARPRIEAPPSPTVADLIAFYADEHFETKGVTVSIPYRATRLALRDAARYRFLRQSEADMGPAAEEVWAAMWQHIGIKGCEGEKFDARIDAGMATFDAATERDDWVTPTTGEK